MRDLRHRSSPPNWQAKLDGFLALNDCGILEHAGRVTAERAKAKAARDLARHEARRPKR
jgi:hypothetical protein